MTSAAAHAVFRERRVSSRDGLALYVRDYGDHGRAATPVLCLSGLTRNSKDFHGLAVRLSVHRRVVALDYRGRGRSAYDPNWQNYVPATYVDDVRNLLVALNLHRVFVIGTSLGGILAMAMGVAAPTALAGALLNDIGPVIDTEGLAAIVRYLKRTGPMENWEEAVERLRSCFPDLPAETEEEWLLLARNVYRQRDDGRIVPDWDPAILKPFLNGPAPTLDLWPLFGSLGRLPVAAVRGALSDVLSDRTFAEMAEAMPGLAQVTVAGVGHAPTLNEPEVQEVLDAVLARADSTDV